MRTTLEHTPVGATQLNMVERFFRDITGKRFRRGVFTSVAELEAVINDYIAAHNANPKPFILERVTRARAFLHQFTSN